MRSIPTTRKECRHIKKIIILKDCIVLWAYNMLVDKYVYSVWDRDGFECLYAFRTYKQLFEYIKTERMVGDIDYAILRNSTDGKKLTEKEFKYCENDELIYTETSIVRHALKKAFKKEHEQ